MEDKYIYSQFLISRTKLFQKTLLYSLDLFIFSFSTPVILKNWYFKVNYFEILVIWGEVWLWYNESDSNTIHPCEVSVSRNRNYFFNIYWSITLYRNENNNANGLTQSLCFPLSNLYPCTHNSRGEGITEIINRNLLYTSIELNPWP